MQDTGPYKPLTLEDAAQYQNMLKKVAQERFVNGGAEGKNGNPASCEQADSTAAIAFNGAVKNLIDLDIYVHEELLPRQKRAPA